MKNCTIEDIRVDLTGARLNDPGFFKSCIKNPSLHYNFLRREVIWPKITKDMKNKNYVLSYIKNHFFGVCSLSICSKDSIAQLYGNIFDENQGFRYKSLEIESFKSEKPEYPFYPFYIYATILAILTTFILYSTFRSQKSIRIEGKKSKNFWAIFDLKENFEKAVKPISKDPLTQAFTLVRIIAIFQIILGHYYVTFLGEIMYIDIPHYINSRRNSIGEGLAQISYSSVCCFFFMGGYVTMISIPRLVKKARKAKKSPFSTLIFLFFRRWFRFFPVVFFTAMTFSKIMPCFFGRILHQVQKTKMHQINRKSHFPQKIDFLRIYQKIENFFVGADQFVNKSDKRAGENNSFERVE